MSKFIESVTAQLTHRERPVIPDLVASLQVGEEVVGRTLQREYRIGVRYESSIFCEPQDLKLAIENFVYMLKQEIYGDLRHRLILLERAVLERDCELVRSIIRDILAECF